MTLANALDPNLMSAAERIAEIGEILALGVLRLREKHCQLDNQRDIYLDFPATPSVHGRRPKPRERL